METMSLQLKSSIIMLEIATIRSSSKQRRINAKIFALKISVMTSDHNYAFYAILINFFFRINLIFSFFEIWAECAPRNVVLSRCGMQHYRRRNYCARGTIVNWGINISLFQSHETIFLSCFAFIFATFTIVTSTRSSNATFYRTCQILWENRIAKITRMNQPAGFFFQFFFRYFCHC